MHATRWLLRLADGAKSQSVEAGMYSANTLHTKPSSGRPVTIEPTMRACAGTHVKKQQRTQRTITTADILGTGTYISYIPSAGLQAPTSVPFQAPDSRANIHGNEVGPSLRGIAVTSGAYAGIRELDAATVHTH